VVGRFLFRWRGVIGFVAFGAVFWLARPTFGSCLFGIPFLVAGLAVRFWASGYIGIAGRVREIGGQREERGVRREEGGTPHRRIVTGPYRILRHPLYIGNFLLVAGMLVALRPAVWLGGAVLVGFVAEYALIIAAEEKDLACRRIQNPESRVQNPEVRTNRQSPESTVHGPLSFLLSRALVEWRTWVVTGVAWGLAVAKALLVRS
jgi:protein-S-isoprenylcysteine O-methyltransferase Ste14